MPIRFEVASDGNFYSAIWQGEVHADEILAAYRAFYESDDYREGMNELADLAQANLSRVSSAFMRRFADFTGEFLIDTNASSMKSAVYAPSDLGFGLARLYEAHAGNYAEEVRVFRDRNEAIDWLGIDTASEA